MTTTEATLEERIALLERALPEVRRILDRMMELAIELEERELRRQKAASR